MGGELCRFDAQIRYVSIRHYNWAASRTSAPSSTRRITMRGLGDGKSTGRAIYTVDGLQHDAPTFYDDILVEFSEDVISGKILDFAGVKEDAGGVCVTTACDGRYLLGLAKDFSLILVRINGDSHLPEAYAYLPSYVDWSLAQGLFGANFTGVTETQEGFGAAYAYEINAVNLRVFFTADAPARACSRSSYLLMWMRWTAAGTRAPIGRTCRVRQRPCRHQCGGLGGPLGLHVEQRRPQLQGRHGPAHAAADALAPADLVAALAHAHAATFLRADAQALSPADAHADVLHVPALGGR